MASFADVANRRLMISRWKPQSKSRDLWKEAITALGQHKPTSQSLLAFASAGNPTEASFVVQKKLEECNRKRLKFRKKNGKEVIISEELEKIAKYVKRFKDLGDGAAQFDPGKSA